MKSKYSAAVTLVTVLAGSSITFPVSGQDTQPNLVLIIADDMNWDDCGAYGHPAIKTPSIDRMAQEGIRFQHAYLTTNSCSPSRSSIITGRYPHNTGAEQLHWPLPEGSVTFVAELQRLGYYTAAAGKWHLGEAAKSDFDKIYEASTAGFVLPSGKDGQPAKMIAAQPSGCEDWVRALEERPNGRPFFLWLAALDPHREYQDGALDDPHTNQDIIVPPHLPDTPAVREDLRLYYDEIGRLDQYVGRVLKKLKEQGCDENTLVLFISDNGRPFPRDKTTLYDGGIRTPWIARWPGHLPQAEVSQSLVSVVDIGATFLEAAGANPQCDFLKQTSGISALPALQDSRRTHRKFAFAEDHWHDYEDHGRAIVTTQFKLIRNDYTDLPNTPPADAGRSPTWQTMVKMKGIGELNDAQLACFAAPRPKWELYDLRRDPGELVNLASDSAYEGIVSELQDELAKWSQRTADYLPSRRTPDEFDRITGEPDHSVRVRPRHSKLQMFGTNGKY